ncbi:HSP70-domain-containing protein [Imleria badia]|nr:HSP70-domain-containing protein [Imleria badia]
MPSSQSVPTQHLSGEEVRVRGDLLLGLLTPHEVFANVTARWPTNILRASDFVRTQYEDPANDMFSNERELIRDNKLLGNFSLVGIPPAPKGVPQIQITFNIDADGIVNVSAKKDQSMTIASSSGLSDKDIECMVSDAEQYAESDKAPRALIEEANEGESVCSDTEKAMTEFKDQLDATKKEKVSKLVGELRELAAKG